MEGESSVEMSGSNSYERRIRRVLSNIRVTVENEDFQKIKNFSLELDNLTKALDEPKTTIAVVGDTGAGKSSLLNALLGHADILPTSGRMASTAVAVEIMANEKNTFEAEIHFLSKEEWFRELKSLFTDISEDGILKSKPSNPKSVEGVAWSKMTSVYGEIKAGESLETFEKRDDVTKVLGKLKPINALNPQQFRKEIERYIESKEKSAGGQFWPIVKYVVLRIPQCEVLKSGVTLVDLPGIRDANPARDQIAQKYIKTCSAVFVVASMHRAQDDKTAKDLLEDHFKRQLMMDGTFGNVTFVCTKTDDLLTSELVREMDLLDKEKEHKDVIEKCEKDIKQFGEENEKIKQEIKNINSRKAQLDKEIKTLEEEKKNKQEDSLMKDLDERISGKQKDLNQLLQDKDSKRDKKDDNEEKIQEKRDEIAEQKNMICIMCAKARNEESRKDIKEIFRGELKEIIRDEPESMVTYEGLNELYNLEVFCASSTDFLKLSGKVDVKPYVFNDVKDTEIPKLREYIHRIMRKRDTKRTERRIRHVYQFVTDVYNYLNEKRTEIDYTRYRAKEVFTEHFSKLQNEVLPKTLSKASEQITKTLVDELRPPIQQGTKNAKLLAVEIANTWVDKGKRSKNSYPLYRAVVLRHGGYRSRTGEVIDFNQELSDPLFIAITVPWSKAFMETLPNDLKNLQQDILKELETFSQELCDKLAQYVSKEKLQKVMKQLYASAAHKLTENRESMEEYIDNEQKDMHRKITQSIQERMVPVYNECSSLQGPGSFQNMIKKMNEHIEKERNGIFEEVCENLVQDLEKLKGEIRKRLEQAVKVVEEDVKLKYKPFLEDQFKNDDKRQKYVTAVAESKELVYRLLKDPNTEQQNEDTVSNPSPSTLGEARTGGAEGGRLETTGSSMQIATKRHVIPDDELEADTLLEMADELHSLLAEDLFNQQEVWLTSLSLTLKKFKVEIKKGQQEKIFKFISERLMEMGKDKKWAEQVELVELTEKEWIAVLEDIKKDPERQMDVAEDLHSFLSKDVFRQEGVWLTSLSLKLQKFKVEALKGKNNDIQSYITEKLNKLGKDERLADFIVIVELTEEPKLVPQHFPGLKTSVEGKIGTQTAAVLVSDLEQIKLLLTCNHDKDLTDVQTTIKGKDIPLGNPWYQVFQVDDEKPHIDVSAFKITPYFEGLLQQQTQVKTRIGDMQRLPNKLKRKAVIPVQKWGMRTGLTLGRIVEIGVTIKPNRLEMFITASEDDKVFTDDGDSGAAITTRPTTGENSVDIIGMHLYAEIHGEKRSIAVPMENVISKLKEDKKELQSLTVMESPIYLTIDPNECCQKKHQTTKSATSKVTKNELQPIINYTNSHKRRIESPPLREKSSKKSKNND